MNGKIGSYWQRMLVLAVGIWIGGLFLGGAVAEDTPAPAVNQPVFKVLLYTRSQGFEHPVVRRGNNGELGLAEKIVVDLGNKYNFHVDVTKDGSKFAADNLNNYQVLFLFTQGDLTKPGGDKQPPMDPVNKEALLQFVNEGGGLMATHCGGADTFHGWQPFNQMIGGEFIGHGAQQEGVVVTVDPDFPAVSHFQGPFVHPEEWYAYKGFQERMHVLQMLEAGKLDGGKKGTMYDRPNYPITWCSYYGDGRVFYTGMGHREDVWQNELYQQMVAKGILWAGKKLEGDASPNLDKIFSSVEVGLERINPPKR